MILICFAPIALENVEQSGVVAFTDKVLAPRLVGGLAQASGDIEDRLGRQKSNNADELLAAAQARSRKQGARETGILTKHGWKVRSNDIDFKE